MGSVTAALVKIAPRSSIDSAFRLVEALAPGATLKEPASGLIA